MGSKTDNLQRCHPPAPPVDEFDRKILSALVADSGISYARLGEMVGLSAPAVHERVKRMRKSGALEGTVAAVNPHSVGKPLLAFIHVDTKGWGKSPQLMALASYPEVEEIHSVTGDTCMLLKVRMPDTQALEALLGQLYDIPGVKATRSYVSLSTYLERPVQAEITEDWPEPPGPVG